MKTFSKSLSLCLALGLVLLFGSVASAAWAYTSRVVVTTPGATVVQYSTPSGYYAYRSTYYGYPPIVTVPALAPPARVIYPAPVVVRPRMYARPVPVRRMRVWWP